MAVVGPVVAQGPRVSIEHPGARDHSEFLRAVQQSRVLHHPWVAPPSTPDAFTAYLGRTRSESNVGFLLRSEGRLVGVVNVDNIVLRAFCSAHLGYYAFRGMEGRGLMTEGVALVLGHAFDRLGLHRLEANIQPDNSRSIAVVRRLGFVQEGFSKRYLRVNGEWRDHERWALTIEDFRPLARTVTA
jgi:ribosomal-protein-alanine N-acetyltransferase